MGDAIMLLCQVGVALRDVHLGERLLLIITVNNISYFIV